jgi:hypothetical protein
MVVAQVRRRLAPGGWTSAARRQRPDFLLSAKFTGLNDRLHALLEGIQDGQLLREAEGSTLSSPSSLLGKNVGDIRVSWSSFRHAI